MIAFSYGGDIWTVPVAGGRAFRLTTDDSYEHSPRWSPDGQWLAFSADRFGNDDVFVMPSSGGQSRQLTFHESDDQVCGWTHDGAAVIFSSRRDDQYPDYSLLYLVNTSGGTPRPLMEAYGVEATISPDGRQMLYTSPGAGAPWWRRHYRGSGSPQVWLYDFATGQHIAITDTGQHETGDDFCRTPSRCPMWGKDGEILTVAEPDDTPNIYRRAADGSWKKVTNYKGDGVRFPTISGDGRIIAFEKDTDIYVMENEGEPQRLEIIAPLDDPSVYQDQKRYSNNAERILLSPDEGQMFIEVRGEVFAGRIVGEDDEAARGRANCISGNNPARDGDFSVSPGGDSLIFTSDRNGNRDLYLAYSSDPETAEFARAFSVKIEQLTNNPEDEHSPRFSPDGQQVAFIRGKGDLVIRNLKSGDERLLLKGWSLLQYDWSPDGNWIAFAREDNEYNADVFIIPAEGGREINISRYPDDDNLPVWSADGRKLAFRSRRKNNDWGLYFVFLRLEDHYKSAADWAEDKRQSKLKQDNEEKKAKEKDKPVVRVEIDTTDMYNRVRFVADLAGEEAQFAISPDGEKFAFAGSQTGERDLYIVDWSGENLKRLTRGNQNPGAIIFAKDGKRVWYLDRGGQLKSVDTDGNKDKTHPFDTRLTVDYAAERQQKFSEIWHTLDEQFYHPDFHGHDWTALRDKYAPLISRASCEPDFGDLVRMLMGELNSSHMGYDSPGYRSSLPTAHLGLDFDFTVGGPGLLIKHVLPEGPGAIIKNPIEPGERLIAINGVRLEPDVNLYRLLQDQVNQPVELLLAKGKRERRAIVKPADAGLNGWLRYNEWVSARRTLVDSLSGGKLGYIHLRGMGDPSLERFEAELYSQASGRDGLLIDVRNNGGGWITDYLLAMLQVRRHAVTFPRDGGPGYPQTRLPLYSWVKPINVLCNDHSFSNAEIFSHAIKTLQRGKLIGVPTPGGVISTSDTKLLDGSSFRIPLRGWYVGTEPERNERRNMEGNGAVPDIIVVHRPDQLTPDDDEQLKTAVKELLNEIEQK